MKHFGVEHRALHVFGSGISAPLQEHHGQSCFGQGQRRGGSRRARQLFEQHHIPYRWVDIDVNESAARYVESLNHGNRSVPTIVWPDGTFLVEPSIEALAEKTGVKIN